MPASPAALLHPGLGLLLVLVGAMGSSAVEPSQPTQVQAARAAYAAALWDEGQAAMRVGQTAKAVSLYQQSLAADPSLIRNHLSLAAAYVEMEQPDQACVHLASYLHSFPGHTVVRAHFAELLLKLERLDEARVQFERFAADCPNRDEKDLKQLIHCHSRLMEIADAAEDEYGQHLHRGIGLFLLARQRSGADLADGESAPEALLCKAAAELTQARLQRPDQARPSWYLYQVWSRLGRRQPALRNLRDAEEAAPFSELSVAEQDGLALAERREQDHGVRK
jgi:Tfp pilus assembly protein PilF